VRSSIFLFAVDFAFSPALHSAPSSAAWWNGWRNSFNVQYECDNNCRKYARFHEGKAEYALIKQYAQQIVFEAQQRRAALELTQAAPASEHSEEVAASTVPSPSSSNAPLSPTSRKWVSMIPHRSTLFWAVMLSPQMNGLTLPPYIEALPLDKRRILAAIRLAPITPLLPDDSGWRMQQPTEEVKELRRKGQRRARDCTIVALLRWHLF
jgi:hypothetical protein